MKPKRPIVILLTAIVAAAVLSDAPAAEPLTLAQTITLPGVQGRIDHFGYDSAGKRLFVAALGNDTVEVIDTAAGKVSARIKNLQAPQGIAFAGGLNCLAIANDKDGSVRLFDGQTFEQIRKIDLNDDADNVRYDPATRWFWVGYGNGGLAAIDAQTGKVLADVKLEAHPESFQLESKGKRIFVNVPHTRHIAVIDRDKQAVIAKWPVRESEANFPMALDEGNRRLFIGCRKPAKLLVLDLDSGRTVTAVDITGDTDDLFYDEGNKRIYVSGGAGGVSVIDQTTADRYAAVGQIRTAPGARTSYFAPKSGKLYVAVPHRDGQQAELRVFKVEAAK